MTSNPRCERCGDTRRCPTCDGAGLRPRIAGGQDEDCSTCGGEGDCPYCRHLPALPDPDADGEGLPAPLDLEASVPARFLGDPDDDDPQD